MRLQESCRRRIATGNEIVGSSRPKSMRGERQYPISILRRRQVVLLKKLRVRGNVRSEPGGSCCELQSEQFVDFRFLAAREMRNDVLRTLFVPLRDSAAQYLVQPSFLGRLRPPAASCDEHEISKRHETTHPDGRGTNAPQTCLLENSLVVPWTIGQRSVAANNVRRVEAGYRKRANGWTPGRTSELPARARLREASRARSGSVG